MIKFAQNRAGTGRADSPSGGGKADLSDLKLPNTSAARTQKKDKSRKRPKSQSQHAKGNGTGHLFDDTDASEVDRKSTASSVRWSSHAVGQHSQHRQQPNGQQSVGNAQPNYAFNPEQYTPGNPQIKDGEDLYQRGLAEALAAELVHNNPTGNPMAAAFAQKYMKGDSYPPTTSGAPSIPEQRTRSKSESSDGHEAAPVAQNDVSRSGLKFGSGQRSRFGGATSRPGAEPDRIQQQAAATAQGHRPDTGESSRANSPALGGFSFQPAGNKQNLSLPQASQGQQRLNHDPNKDHKVSNVPVRTATLLDLRSLAPHGPWAHQAQGQVNRQAATIVPQYKHSSNEPPAMQHPQETGLNMAAPQYQQEFPSDDYGPEQVQDEMWYDEHGEDKSLVQSDDDKPDHKLEELYAMDYQSLKAESMEKAPDAESYAIEGVDDSAPVSDKLVAVHKASLTKDPRMAHKMQSDFFASLTIDEWDEAGDWFLGRFSEVVIKLRSFRRDKRKAAKAFESEIEGRDIAVAAKRKLTEQALHEMRQNGQNVLQSTPKGEKKSR